MTRMTGPGCCAVMCNSINTHTHTHMCTHTPLTPPWEDQSEWHRMARMTEEPDCAVMCSLKNIAHTHTHTEQQSMTYHNIMSFGLPDPTASIVKNKHTHKRAHTHAHTHLVNPPWEDQSEWHGMTRMTGPSCVAMCNLIKYYT